MHETSIVELNEKSCKKNINTRYGHTFLTTEYQKYRTVDVNIPNLMYLTAKNKPKELDMGTIRVKMILPI